MGELERVEAAQAELSAAMKGTDADRIARAVRELACAAIEGLRAEWRKAKAEQRAKPKPQKGGAR